MATSLQEIRARIAAQENKTATKSSGSGDNGIYAHWNMDEGTTATLRFLPDGNTTNPFFWVEKNIIKLAFNGVKGESATKRIEVQVPCVEMYGPEHHCPILQEVRPWYKDPTLIEQANKYWKKRSYLFQGFVRANPIGDDTTPANPIRRFVISPQLIAVIKASLMDPELEELPTDYLRGLDLNIKKTTKGGYADYSTSTWSRKESALTEAEQAAIDTHGLLNLASFLPKMPGEAELKIIKAMFDASVDGKPYDLAAWGNYYRPWGLEAPGAKGAQPPAESSPVTPVAVAPSGQAWEDTPAEPAVTTKVATGDKASDILALIRSRQTKPN